ncbi:MAG: methyltransferase domain-containing protein [Chloroflexi bacterium]|nr:methyltransferase domain-containing protein [Chloroflexota bacterium]
MNDEPWYVELFRRGAWFRRFVPRIDPALTARQVEFIVEALGLPPGASVLDLCCGPGRHAVPLAQRGFAVTGLDLSAYHLRLARQAARQAGVGARWVQSDMREIPFATEFDAVINIFTSFAYFESDEEDFRVLTGVSWALKPGGRFLIDTINREWLMRHFQPTRWEQLPDGSLHLERPRFDPLTSRVESEWILVTPSGRRETHTIRLRWYTLTEMAKMLSRAGMTVRQVWGGFDGQQYGLDSPRMIVLAQKEGSA